MRLNRERACGLIGGSLVITSQLLGAPADAKMLNWEQIETTCPDGIPSGNSDCTFTQRLKVPGGWLVRSMRLNREGALHNMVPGYPGGPSGSYSTGGGLGTGVGLTFLPDPSHTWQP